MGRAFSVQAGSHTHTFLAKSEQDRKVRAGQSSCCKLCDRNPQLNQFQPLQAWLSALQKAWGDCIKHAHRGVIIRGQNESTLHWQQVRLHNQLPCLHASHPRADRRCACRGCMRSTQLSSAKPRVRGSRATTQQRLRQRDRWTSSLASCGGSSQPAPGLPWAGPASRTRRAHRPTATRARCGAELWPSGSCFCCTQAARLACLSKG